ncbi:hypothetical protein N7495_003333 [Penicillium taxi]|uniref:uncharacterized protein n=1 Tax=Penicillium taxi TaxID=168475 RepID=UPI00254532F2|nr:uncharacterized protein N7495_003333 [Penicillium taxi]KAJ5902805.1 hypothetical protein N7495_003333 [Penicillium taxi]
MSTIEEFEQHASIKPPLSKALGGQRLYSPDATILLVGFFGAGKKTLGIIASVALRRRFIDFAAFFQQEIHLSPQDFISRHGLARYREVELDLSRDLLQRCSKDSIIVGLGGSASRSQNILLAEFAKQHPVIYVRRSESDLQQFVSTTPDKFERMFEAGNLFFESCSNFDFFNHTQGQQPPADRAVPMYLKLKETERVFVTFLYRIYGQIHRPVFKVDPFSASYTYALQVPLTWLDEPQQDVESLETGADAITLVISPADLNSNKLFSRIVQHVATLRIHSHAPIIIDVAASPFARTTSNDYPKLIEMIIRLAPDAITCSLDCDAELIANLNASKGYTRIIGTVCEVAPVGCSRRLLSPAAICHQAQKLKIDTICVTGQSVSIMDHNTCLCFSQNIAEILNIPVIAYNTGSLGRSSVCLNPTLSPVVLRSIQSEGVTVQEAQQALSSCFLKPRKDFTIFGQIVKHSISPAMHNLAYSVCGLPYQYHTLQTENFADIHELLNDENHAGVAISLPYKSAILPFLDETSPDAKDINAVNTVVMEQRHRSNGEPFIYRKGYNTDYIGIRNCIYKHLSPANAVRDGTTALIVGAGGMAHAAVYSCYELGVQQICIYNRTSENSQKLADYYNNWAASKPDTKLQLTVLHAEDDWPAHLRLPTIVVACIPPFQIDNRQPVAFQISEKWLQSRTGGVFVEIAYGPFLTLLTEQMSPRKSKGWVVVDGLKVLLEQGIAQYELFTKRPAPIHVMRRAIQEEALRLGYVHE